MLGSLALWIGATLVLSEVRWFARPPLAQRLRPYVPGGLAGGGRSGLLSMESFRDVVAPLSRSVGERLARLFGVSEELAVKLDRIHSPLDVTAFRVRQVGRMTAAMGLAGLLALDDVGALVDEEAGHGVDDAGTVRAREDEDVLGGPLVGTGDGGHAAPGSWAVALDGTQSAIRNSGCASLTSMSDVVGLPEPGEALAMSSAVTGAGVQSVDRALGILE